VLAASPSCRLSPHSSHSRVVDFHSLNVRFHLRTAIARPILRVRFRALLCQKRTNLYSDFRVDICRIVIVIVDGHIVVYDFDFIFDLSVGYSLRIG
jgi:hypothetical protein